MSMKTESAHYLPELPPLPWHIYFDLKGKGEREKSGRIIHIIEPFYECQFYIGSKPKMTKGFAILNAGNNVQLYDLKLPEGKELVLNFKEINTSLKEASRFLYDILYLPFFRDNQEIL